MIVSINEEEIRQVLDELLAKTGLSIMDIHINFDMVDVSANCEGVKRLIQPSLTVVFHLPDKFIEMEE